MARQNTKTANAHLAHLQVAQANDSPKLAKELNLADPMPLSKAFIDKIIFSLLIMFCFSLMGCWTYKNIEYNEINKTLRKTKGLHLDLNTIPRDWFYWEKTKVYDKDNRLIEFKRIKVHRTCRFPQTLKSLIKKYYTDGKLKSIEKYTLKSGMVFHEFDENGVEITLFSKDEIIKMIDSLKNKINDSLTKVFEVENDILSMIETLNGNLNGNYFFPYQLYDSITYSECKKSLIYDSVNFLKCNVVNHKSINLNKADSLLKLINNPLYYKLELDCDIENPEAQFEFWHNDYIIARVYLFCSNREILCEPENVLNNWCILNEKGKILLNKIIH